MNRNLRGALAAIAILITVPVTASAQQQQGDVRGSDHLSRAKALVGKKRYKAALAIFDSLVRAEPGSREAALGRAQMLAWMGRIADAVRAYERWVRAHPRDFEAAELLAQALSWSDRLDDAERLYKVLALGGSPGAERGLARIAARRGDLSESERRWRGIVAKRPDDSEAWVGLAQVLRWTGRSREARDALTHAMKADPSNRDAAEQLAWVDAALSPRVDPTISSLEDTDGNRLLTIGATIALVAPWDGELSVRAQRRAGALGAQRASSLGAAVAAGRTTARYAIRGSIGAARLDDASGTATRDVLTASATIVGSATGRLRFGAGVGREPFDETAPLIRRGIVTTTLGTGASVDVSRRVELSAEVEHARLGGATPNTRTGGTASLRWRAPFVLSLASTVRAFGYASDPLEGYFAPRRYVLAEGSARLAVGRDLGWSATLDGGFGSQTIDTYTAGSATRPAARGALTILYRPTPRLEWGVAGNITNAVSPATSTLTSYRTSGWSLRGRITF